MEIRKLKTKLEKISALQVSLAGEMRSLAVRIEGNEFLAQEDVDGLGARLQNLKTMQDGLIAEVGGISGDAEAYAGAVRVANEDFGGFFSITSDEDDYKNAIEGFGEQFLRLGSALFENAEAIELLNAISAAVRSQEAFTSAGRTLREKLFALPRGPEVYSGLWERAFYFMDTQQKTAESEDAEKAEEAENLEEAEKEEETEKVEGTEKAEEEIVFPETGKEDDGKFSVSKFKSDFQVYWRQCYRILMILGKDGLCKAEDVRGDGISMELTENYLKKLHQRAFIYCFEYEGEKYWLIGRKGWLALKNSTLFNSLPSDWKALVGKLTAEENLHSEWIRNGVVPAQLVRDVYLPLRAAEESEAAEEESETATGERETAAETEEEATRFTERVREPIEAESEEQGTEDATQPAEGVREPIEAESEEQSTEDAVQSAEGAQESIEADAGERAAVMVQAQKPEEDPQKHTEEPKKSAIEDVCAEILTSHATPKDEAAFLAAVRALLEAGRIVEAGFLLDAAVRKEKELKDGKMDLLRDQIKYISNIPQWPPEHAETALLQQIELGDAALSAALFYGVQLVHYVRFPKNGRIDFAPSREEFARIGLDSAYDDYYDVVHVQLGELPRYQGGYAPDDVSAIVSAEAKQSDLASRANELRSEKFKSRLHDSVISHLFEAKKNSTFVFVKYLSLIADREEIDLDGLKADMREVFPGWGESTENEPIKESDIETFIDNVVWEKAKSLAATNSLPDRVKHEERKALIDFIGTRFRLIYKWYHFSRTEREIQDTIKYKNYQKIIDGLAKLEGTLVRKTAAAHLLGYAAGKLKAYLGNKKADPEFDFILTGNEFFLNDAGLPELGGPWDKADVLPPAWYRAVRQFSRPALGMEEALSAVSKDEEEGWFGNNHTGRAIAGRLGRPFTEGLSAEKIKKKAENEEKNFRSETEKDCLYARINDIEKERLYYACKCLKEAYAGQDPELGKYLQGLNDLRAECRRMSEARDRDFREHLDDLRKQYPDAQMVENIEKKIDERNYAVAEDCIALLGEGVTEVNEPIQDTAMDGLERFLNDFKHILSFFTAHKSQKFSVWAPYAAKEYLDERGEGDAWPESKRFFEAWNFDNGKNAETTALHLLRFCGFDIPGPPKKCTTVKDRYDVFLYPAKNTDPTFDSFVHPIREFGTALKNITVFCFYGKDQVDSIITAVNERKTRGAATVVFCDAPIVLQSRKNILKAFKEGSKENSFLLIDQVLAFYLGCQTQGKRLSELLQCTLPFTGYNPYGQSDLAPEMFVQRKELRRLHKIDDRAAWVYGGRQLGKTALLKRACTIENDGKEPPERCAIYVSVQRLPNDGEDFFVKKLSEALIGKKLISNRVYKDNAEIRKALENTLRRNSKLQIRLYIDEGDDYFASLEKSGETNALAPFVELGRGEFAMRFKFVLAGTHHVARHADMISNNSVIGQMDSLVVEPFGQAEARSLIERPFAFLGIKIEPKDIELIAVRANFFPGVIQEICREIVQTIQSDPALFPNPYYTVDEKLLKNVCGKQEISTKIREKIMLTLSVDNSNAYKAIAYLFASHYYDEPLKGFSPAELLEQAKTFANNRDVGNIAQMSIESIEILLDELRKMSILRMSMDEAKNKRYMLRKASFAEMIGSAEAVESYLLKED